MVEEVAGERPRKVLADAGYGNEGDLAALEDREIDGYVALGREGKEIEKADPERARMVEKLATPEGRAVYAKRKWMAEAPIWCVWRSTCGDCTSCRRREGPSLRVRELPGSIGTWNAAISSADDQLLSSSKRFGCRKSGLEARLPGLHAHSQILLPSKLLANACISAF